MAVSLVGPVSSPSAVQWSLSSRPLPLATSRVSAVSVRASKNVEDGETSGGCAGTSGSVGLSRRAVIALIALSSQLGGVASARNISALERVRLENLRNLQQQRKNVPADEVGSEASLPGTAADVSGPVESSMGEEFPSLSMSVAEVPNTPETSQISTDLGIMNEVPKALADSGVGAVEEKINQPASEVSSGGSNGFGPLSLVGVLGTGVAGALYYSERQSKAQAESALETASKELQELRDTSKRQLLAEKQLAQKEASKAEEQCTKLTDELLASRSSVTDLEGKLQMAKASVVDLQERVSSLQVTLANQEKNYSSLSERFVEEKEVGEMLRDEITMLKSTLANKEKDYISLNERFVTERATAEELQEKIKILKMDIETKENEINSQAARIKEEENSIISLQNELQTAGIQLGEERSKLAEERSKLAEESSKLAEESSKLAEASSELAEERSKLAALEGSYAASQDLNTQLDLSISDLKQELQTTISRKEALEKEVTILNEEVNSLKATLAEEKDKKDNLYGQLKETSGALEKSTSEVQLLEQRVTNMSAAVKALEKEKDDEISQITNELQEKTKSLDVAVERSQQFSNAISSLQTQQAALNEELDNTNKELELSTQEMKTISEQLTVAVNLSLKLETQLNETRAAYQSANVALAEERKVTAAAKNQLATTQRSLIAEKNSVKALRGSVDQALLALQELNQDSLTLADELDKAKKKIANLEAESASVRQKLVKEKEMSANLRSGAAQAEGTVARLHKENDAANRKVKQLEGEILKSKGEMAKQKGKLLEQKRALQQAETRLKMIPQVRAEAALLVEKYEDLAYQEKEEKEAIMREKEELMKSGKTVGADLSEVKQSLEDGKAARSEMEAVLGALQEAVADNSS